MAFTAGAIFYNQPANTLLVLLMGLTREEPAFDFLLPPLSARQVQMLSVAAPYFWSVFLFVLFVVFTYAVPLEFAGFIIPSSAIVCYFMLSFVSARHAT
ncbi:hypothetical protein QBC34DRAFT_413559 [Podospora aff. communis PSN243]|uniref:Uncharacterized protein n=1 Tax=Podospora aff. communis PSN243 TaxID=3040156 RepID=A0AAV9GAW6_9PEZI|nr:hypothetical protein QBC34DRAFT_413559 [Podospora aff. communis PSN243]